MLNGRAFLVNASVGLYPKLLQDREAFKQQYGRNRVVAMWAGGKAFHLATPDTYRRVAYVVIIMSAIFGMPLFDRWLRG